MIHRRGANVPQGLQPDIRNTAPELRALGFGELLDTVFSHYRTHFLSFFWNCFRLLYSNDHSMFDRFP